MQKFNPNKERNIKAIRNNIWSETSAFYHLLLITYIDNITKKAKLQNENINDLLFANDQDIIACKEIELQHQIIFLNIECKNNNIKNKHRKDRNYGNRKTHTIFKHYCRKRINKTNK
jgi:hypothetical protein